MVLRKALCVAGLTLALTATGASPALAAGDEIRLPGDPLDCTVQYVNSLDWWWGNLSYYLTYPEAFVFGYVDHAGAFVTCTLQR